MTYASWFAAAFLPAVLFISAANNVLLRNTADLLYHPPLVTKFAVAFAVSWLVLGVVFRLSIPWSPLRIIVRLCVVLAWLVLISDAVRPVLEGRSFAVLAITDAVAVLVLAAIVSRLSLATLMRTSAAVAVILAAFGAITHVRAAKALDRTLVADHAAARWYAPPPTNVAKGNVYHLVLDTYQSETFPLVRERHPELTFDGFRNYYRFNTNYPHTLTAMSALLRGRYYDSSESFRLWHRQSPREGLWPALQRAGVSLSLYPYIAYFCPERSHDCLPTAKVVQNRQATLLSDRLVDLWFLNILPNAPRHALSGGSLRPEVLRGEAAGTGAGFSITARTRGVPLRSGELLAVKANAMHQLFNFEQFNMVLAEEERRPATGQYVFYHAAIPHGPFTMTSTCDYRPLPPAPAPATTTSRFPPPANAAGYVDHAACATRMAHLLAERLRSLGRFDDALIIVQADHGDPNDFLRQAIPGLPPDFPLDKGARRYQAADPYYLNDDNWWELSRGDSAKWRSIAVEVSSSGLLLVKMPGAHGYDESDAPVQLIDIAPTVLKHFGLPLDGFAGVALHDPAPMQARENLFFAHARYTADGFPLHQLSRYRLGPAGWEFAGNVETRDDKNARLFTAPPAAQLAVHRH